MDFEDDIAEIRSVSPPKETLRVSEGLTIPCLWRSVFGKPGGGAASVTKADLAIAIYYRPWPITFLRLHRLFRFVARFNEKGEVVGWDKQPAEPLEKDFEDFMKSPFMTKTAPKI